MQRILNKIKTNFLKAIKKIILTGTSVEKLALSVVIGILVGIVPLLGLVTGIATVIAVVLRLNMAAIQLAHYIIYPFQLILFVPFIKAGQLFFGDASAAISVMELMHMFKADFLGTMKSFWLLNLGGLLAWLMISIPTGFIMYYMFVRVFRQLQVVWIRR